MFGKSIGKLNLVPLFFSDRPRPQTPTEKGSTKTDVKPRPRPNAATTQPTPKPRTISLTQSRSTSLNMPSEAPSKSRSLSQVAPFTTESELTSFSQSVSSSTSKLTSSNQSSQEDLISFHSPEKPKNDILSLLHNINANQSAVVPITTSQGTYTVSSTYRQSFTSPQPTVRPPVSSFSAYQSTLASVLGGSQWSVAGQNGMTPYPNYSSSLSSPTFHSVIGQSSSLSGSLSFKNFQNPGQLVPITQVSSGSQSAPPIPQRSPNLDINLALGNHLPGSQSTTTALGTPTKEIPGTGNFIGKSATTTRSDLMYFEKRLAVNDSVDVATKTDTLGARGGSVSLGTPTSETPFSATYVKKSASTPKDDLMHFDKGSLPSDSEDVLTKTSVLEVFDPIVLKAKEEEQILKKSSTSQGGTKFDPSSVAMSKEARELLSYKSHKPRADDEMSYYEQVDPFEYMHPGPSSSRSDPVYDVYDGLVSPGTVDGETFDIPPPLPPRSNPVDGEVHLRKGSRKSQLQREITEEVSEIKSHVGNYIFNDKIYIT